MERRLSSIFLELADEPEVDNFPRQVVEERPVLVDGSLRPLSEEEDIVADVDLSDVAYQLPREMRRALRERYGDALSERELNLLVSGVELAMSVAQKWVQVEGIFNLVTQQVEPRPDSPL